LVKKVTSSVVIYFSNPFSDFISLPYSNLDAMQSAILT